MAMLRSATLLLRSVPWTWVMPTIRPSCREVNANSWSDDALSASRNSPAARRRSPIGHAPLAAGKVKMAWADA